MTEVTGEEPTADDQFWLATAASDLTPDKSLQRITDKVGFIFSNLTLAGAVLAGAGIVVGSQSRTSAHPALLLTLIVLVFASVAAALVANLPSMQSQINPSDPDAIRRYYEHTIRWKGWFARSGLLLFSAALVFAFILVIGTAAPGPSAQLSIQWTPLGSVAQVHATAEAAGLGGQSAAETTLTAFTPNGASVVLSRGITNASADGTLTFTTDIKTSAVFSSVVLSVVVKRNGRNVESRTMKLRI